MSNGKEKVCNQVRHLLQINEVLESEIEIQNATKFRVESGTNKAAINVFNTGRMNVEGSESELKAWLLELKNSIESGAGAPRILLPVEIDNLPQSLQERVPSCDSVIVWFLQEALKCYKANSIAGAVFMLGAASEKAILNLIDTYASRIGDETNRAKFMQRINNRMISVKYEEFKRSYGGSNPKSTDLLITQDLDQILDTAFNFYRITRNAVGHPQVIPDLDKGVVLANIGQFVMYVERIYRLIAFFRANSITV